MPATTAHKGAHVHVHPADGSAAIEGTVLYAHDDGALTIELLHRPSRATPPVKVHPASVVHGFPVACTCTHPCRCSTLPEHHQPCWNCRWRTKVTRGDSSTCTQCDQTVIYDNGCWRSSQGDQSCSPHARHRPAVATNPTRT